MFCSGAVIAEPYRVPEFTQGFYWGSCLSFCPFTCAHVCRSAWWCNLWYPRRD